jgi:hypothetical protein
VIGEHENAGEPLWRKYERIAEHLRTAAFQIEAIKSAIRIRFEEVGAASAKPETAVNADGGAS